MSYAVKITATLRGVSLSEYAGARGEKSYDLNKIDGWKRKISAEKFIDEHKRMFGFGDSDIEYEIISL